MQIKRLLISVLVLVVCFPFSSTLVKGAVPSSPDSSPPLQTFISACKNRINIPDTEMHWLFIPRSAAELRTEIMYGYLAGQLIKNGSVDASACPAGGLGVNDYANACGQAAARRLVISFQNLYDEAILKAWEATGVPPILLKQLIRYESQFWPGRDGEYHYGLGHVTFFGAHTALTWRMSLYRTFCSLTGTCNTGITSATINAFLDNMDATCPTCQYKLDLQKAVNSVYYLAETVYAYCEQTAQIVYNISNRVSSEVVDYPTIWKMTLMNYNVGPFCVLDAFTVAYSRVDIDEDNNITKKVTWDDIAFFTTDPYCSRGVTYVDQVTAPFYETPTQ